MDPWISFTLAESGQVLKIWHDSIYAFHPGADGLGCLLYTDCGHQFHVRETARVVARSLKQADAEFAGEDGE